MLLLFFYHFSLFLFYFDIKTLNFKLNLSKQDWVLTSTVYTKVKAIYNSKHTIKMKKKETK